MKRFLLLCLTCCGIISASAQTQEQVLKAAQKTNDYFMMKYSDPTLPTNVKKIRPSSLWTRAVYYEGLMALNAIDPQQRYLDYTFKWSDFHKWTPRNGVKTTDADDQCCEQTYIEYNQLTGKGPWSKSRRTSPNRWPQAVLTTGHGLMQYRWQCPYMQRCMPSQVTNSIWTMP